MTAGETRNVQVLGVAGVPTSAVSAVVVDIAVHGATEPTSSFLTAWASGVTRPVVSSLYFNRDNAPRSNTAVVPVGSNGKISIYNYAGLASVTVDIQGYFTTTSTAGSSGGFVALHTPTRVANTQTGAGIGGTSATLAPGASRDIQVTGVGDINSSATAVFANVEVNDAASVGHLRVGPGGTALVGIGAIDYGPEGRQDSGLSIKLNSSGQMRITNTTGGSPVHFKIDVQGYFSGDPTIGGSFTALSPTNVYSTGYNTPLELQGHETRAIKIAGVGGLPGPGTLGSAVLTVSVKNWKAGGTVAIFSNDIAWPGTSNVGFNFGEGDPANGTSSTAIARVSAKGYIALYNTSSKSVSVTLTTQGWFSPAALSRTPEDNQVTLSGVVTGTSSLIGAEVTATLDLDRQHLAAAQDGDVLHGFRLPESAVHIAGNKYLIAIDPAAVPIDYIEDDGSVTVNVTYYDTGQELIGRVTKSVQLIEQSTAPAAYRARTWARAGDPELVPDPAPGEYVGEESATDEPLDPAAEGTSADDESGEAVEEEEVVPVESDFAIPAEIADVNSGVAARAVAGQAASGVQCCDATEQVRTKKIWTTIGATYPTGGSVARMSVSNNFSTTTGIAITGYGGSFSWSAKGSKTVSGESGWTFHDRPYPQSYRTQVLYGLYKVYGWPAGSYRLEWRPIESTGGFRPFRIAPANMPNWKSGRWCSPVSDGVWYRSSRKGRDYSLSYGVKLKDVIGFDLSSSHSWSKRIDSVYDITPNQHMCGKDYYYYGASKWQMK